MGNEETNEIKSQNIEKKTHSRKESINGITLLDGVFPLSKKF